MLSSRRTELCSMVILLKVIFLLHNLLIPKSVPCFYFEVLIEDLANVCFDKDKALVLYNNVQLFFNNASFVVT